MSLKTVQEEIEKTLAASLRTRFLDETGEVFLHTLWLMARTNCGPEGKRRPKDHSMLEGKFVVKLVFQLF